MMNKPVEVFVYHFAALCIFCVLQLFAHAASPSHTKKLFIYQNVSFKENTATSITLRRAKL